MPSASSSATKINPLQKVSRRVVTLLSAAALFPGFARSAPAPAIASPDGMPLLPPGTGPVPAHVVTAAPPLPVGGLRPPIKPDLRGPRKPRELPEKPTHAVVGPGMLQDAVRVKFKNGLKLRVQNGRLANLQPETEAAPTVPTKSGAQSTGSSAVVVPTTVAAQLTMLPAGTWRGLPGCSPEEFDAARVEGETAGNEELADLNLYFTLALPSPSEVSNAIDRLNALDIVEYAAPVPAFYPPADVRDSQAKQIYLRGVALGGTGAKWVWKSLNLPDGIHGEGIQVCDVEYGFDNHHHDLPPVTVINRNWKDRTELVDHGTAALGVLFV